MSDDVPRKPELPGILAAFPWLKPAVGCSTAERMDAAWFEDAAGGSPVARLVRVVHAIQAEPGPHREFWIPWTVGAAACWDRFHGTLRDDELWYGIQTIEMLSALPPSWIPKDEASFRVALFLSLALEYEWACEADTIASLFRSVGGRWTEFAERIGAIPPGKETVSAILASVGDMIRFVGRHLVRPVLENRGGGEHHTAAVALALITPDGGLPLLMERSKRWHAVFAGLPGLAVEAEPEMVLSWPELAAPYRAKDGTDVVFLSTPLELAAEGEAMDHCVSTYADVCSTGAAHVASVSAPDAAGVVRRLSTVHVSMSEGRPKIVQHRGRSNVAAEERAVEALAEWSKAVDGGTVRLDPRAMVRRTPRTCVMEIPEGRSPAEWKGVLARRHCAGTWDDLVAEIRRLDAEVSARREDAPEFLDDELAA